MFSGLKINLEVLIMFFLKLKNMGIKYLLEVL